jgi:hypothetical protein
MTGGRAGGRAVWRSGGQLVDHLGAGAGMRFHISFMTRCRAVCHPAFGPSAHPTGRPADRPTARQPARLPVSPSARA